jgi:DNA helicase-2/ATP-dependent DNA helicase PcrA
MSNQNNTNQIQLNKRQAEAVEYTDGPLLILAGAGAGKTKTIVERIINIIKKGTEPKNILAITFTNKAAKEMRERVMKRIEEEGMYGFWNNSYINAPTIKTFHSLGMYILQEEYLAANLTKRLTIYDEPDSLGIIKDILEKESIDPKMFEPKKIKNAISRLKSDFIEISDYQAKAFSPFQKTLARVWLQYENVMKEKKVVDFDDLIIRTVKLLQANENIKKKYQEKWKYLHIDEYQDTNNSQYIFCKLLVNENLNVCAVGDVDQNIYSWRGANLKNLLRFEEDFRTTPSSSQAQKPPLLSEGEFPKFKEIEPKIILLEQNYRSTKKIIEAANEIIKINQIRKEKVLFTENEEGDLIEYFGAYDDKNEADFIAKKIMHLQEIGSKMSEICILYRANFQSRVLEQAMLANGIKYHILGTKFFDRKEVKDVMSYLRLSENKTSTEDLKRAITNPVRGFGKVALGKILSGQENLLSPDQQYTLEKFWKVVEKINEAKNVLKPSEIILQIIVESGMESSLKEKADEESIERLGNIYELVALAKEYDKFDEEEAGSGLTKFIEEASLVSDQDTDTEESDKIKMMTIHASKGLEFENVFITGLEQGLFPSEKMDSGNLSKEEREEERRLFYVAITRARKRLFLTSAEKRMLFGQVKMQMPSEFIGDIPEHLMKPESLTPNPSPTERGEEKKKSYLNLDEWQEPSIQREDRFDRKEREQKKNYFNKKKGGGTVYYL